MNKRVFPQILLIAFALFITGLFLVFSAPSAGLKAGNAAVRKNGGSMDTNQYERIVDATVTSYHVGGGIISLVGGAGLLVSGLHLLQPR